jgi:hypothetical protein
LDDGTSEVRDAAAKTFGTLSLVVGERAITGYIAKLDPIKQKKVKDSTPQSLPPAALAALAAPPPEKESNNNNNTNNNNNAAPEAKLKRAPSGSKDKKVVEEKKKEEDVVVTEKKSSIQKAVSKPPPRIEVSQGGDDGASSGSVSSISDDSKPTPPVRYFIYFILCFYFIEFFLPLISFGLPYFRLLNALPRQRKLLQLPNPLQRLQRESLAQKRRGKVCYSYFYLSLSFTIY